uniref:Zinc finger, CCHC-type n=1 Tax=Tanacetum cinerariifolium TaxID=118510 RepID=A0A6L2J0G8_TANCI|nr:zinc finger, CCHC-type [Tanacetum cinerariifolium]
MLIPQTSVEDPNQHLKDFLKLVDLLDLDGENKERTRLHLFQSSIYDQASNWLERLLAGSITTWEDITTRFLAKSFPPGRTTKLRNDISMFQQHQGESLSEAWTRSRTYSKKQIPHRLWPGVILAYSCKSSTSLGDFSGSLHMRATKQSREPTGKANNIVVSVRRGVTSGIRATPEPFGRVGANLIEDDESLRGYVPSTSDRRLIELENQVQRLMEVHLALTQPTQVKKITTSCGICRGPHDTQYCMEDPKQAFVEYASLRIDEAGGSLPSDTVKNLKLSTSPVLSAHSYPTEVPQCSTDIHGSNKDDEGIEWLDVEEPLDLVDTSEESVYESLIKEMPKCSINYDFRIKKGDIRNLKIPCMIVFLEIVFNDLDLLEYSSSISLACRRTYDNHTAKDNLLTCLQHPSSYTSGHLEVSESAACLEKLHFPALLVMSKFSRICFLIVILEVPFSEYFGFDMKIILSEDDYDRGCRKPSDLEEGFYRDTIKLGPKYVTEMDDEGGVA